MRKERILLCLAHMSGKGQNFIKYDLNPIKVTLVIFNRYQL
ncbi:hypothetical protein [Parabacteroides sp. ZJ-118]|nr:hypothetical protein [Parabacteroides sp. ZJ-118]